MGRAAFRMLARLMAMLRAGGKGKSVRFESYAKSRPFTGPAQAIGAACGYT